MRRSSARIKRRKLKQSPQRDWGRESDTSKPKAESFIAHERRDLRDSGVFAPRWWGPEKTQERDL